MHKGCFVFRLSDGISRLDAGMDALSETDGFAVCGHGGQRNDGVPASQQHDLCDAGLDGHSADFRRKAASENRMLCGGGIGFVADGQSGTCDGDARGEGKYQGDVIRSHTAAFPRAQVCAAGLYAGGTTGSGYLYLRQGL